MAINLQTEQLRQLRASPTEVWQGGLLAIPGGKVRDKAGDAPFDPFTCLWVSSAGPVHVGDVGPAESVTPAVIVNVLVEFATGLNRRPGRLEVGDPAHAAALSAVVGPLGITVDVVDHLAGLQAIAGEIFGGMPGMGGEPDALADDPAITPDRLAGFAAAAAAFFNAKAWGGFGPTDLVRVVSPRVPKPLRFFNVMGGGGEQFGLAFFPSAAAFGEMVTAPEPGQYALTHPMVSVTFDTAQRLPPGDVAAWKAHRLPTVKLGRRVMYPFPVTFNRGVWVRPTAAELAVMQDLLAAVAAVRPADLDAGHWSATVTTAEGPVAYSFELQSVGRPQFHLDRFAPAAGLAGPPETDADRLIAQAWEADSRRAAALARHALAADPDAVDAYVILGETAPNAAAAVDFYRQGIAAGDRKLGERFIAENTGQFWGLLETRPYMRALGGLANALRSTGRPDEAIDVWQRMLTLNPNDNQGVRYLLTAVLLERGRDADLSALLARYDNDGGVIPLYAGALLRFRAEGDSPAAVERLRLATAANPHMVAFLTGRRRPPKVLPDAYSRGQETEAAAFAADLLPGWRGTPGAIDWLRSHTAVAASDKPTAKPNPAANRPAARKPGRRGSKPQDGL